MPGHAGSQLARVAVFRAPRRRTRVCVRRSATRPVLVVQAFAVGPFSRARARPDQRCSRSSWRCWRVMIHRASTASSFRSRVSRCSELRTARPIRIRECVSYWELSFVSGGLVARGLGTGGARNPLAVATETIVGSSGR